MNMTSAPRIVLLTSTAPRHRFLADTLQRTCTVAGIVSERKRAAPAGSGETGDAVMQEHIAGRDSAEKAFFGSYGIFPVPAADMLEIEAGHASDPDTVAWIGERKPDALVLFGSSIIRDSLLSRFPDRVINLHLGLSPYYRGTATNFWPLVYREPECTGATIHLAVRKVDAGGIIAQARPDIAEGDGCHEIGCKALPERAALVTFDDTLREQYTDALPVLDRLGVPAVFFANGLPYAEQKALEIHKVHWLRAHIPANEFLQMLARHVTEITGTPFDMAAYPVSEDALRQRYKYGNLAELRVRHLLYAGLPQGVRSKAIERMFAEAAGDEKDFCRKTYIPASGLRDLASRGFLGIHGYGHHPLGMLSREEQRKELEHCVTAVAEASSMPERRFAAISYSYGTPDAVTPDVAALAAALGFRIGFTMERAINRTFLDPLRMARVDANDIPEGKKPLFEIRDGNIRITATLLASHRPAEKGYNHIA